MEMLMEFQLNMTFDKPSNSHFSRTSQNWPTLINLKVKIGLTKDVAFSHEFIRMVPSMPFKTGSIWCETPNPHQ
jgi:hypothetical protein